MNFLLPASGAAVHIQTGIGINRKFYGKVEGIGQRTTQKAGNSIYRSAKKCTAQGNGVYYGPELGALPREGYSCSAGTESGKLHLCIANPRNIQNVFLSRADRIKLSAGKVNAIGKAVSTAK